MTTTRDPVDVFGIDTELDLPISDQDESERNAQEVAHQIRRVAATDRAQAQQLVDRLIVGLDQAVGGTFREHLDRDARDVAERELSAGTNGAGAGVSPARIS